MFTRFMDMHSGGSLKEDPLQDIYIEADTDEAKAVFYCRFGHNPERVTCTCCGEDYSISTKPTLEAASAYDRGCQWGDGAYDLSTAKVSIEEYLARPDVLVIRADEIKPSERVYGSPNLRGTES